ncbi:hypothetical protein GCM10009547_06960 [Sporichthya brevicatena]|uniref:Uncharacterized protein n=1 Tax=Sporichthya brevicatena TaxID=171442 RepID=A0ABN1GAT8_9ACTN
MNPMTFVRAQWDRVGAWVCIAGGAIVLLLGWWGISGTTSVGRQLPYIISGGLFGVFLLGLGGLLWVSADLRDEWRELWSIRDALVKIAAGQGGNVENSAFALTPEEHEEAAAVLAGGQLHPVSASNGSSSSHRRRSTAVNEA